jgi:hypothetical protein
MLAAWMILANRRQKKPTFTDPAIDLGAESAPILLNFRFVPIAGTISHHWSLFIQITKRNQSRT